MARLARFAAFDKAAFNQGWSGEFFQYPPKNRILKTASSYALRQSDNHGNEIGFDRNLYHLPIPIYRAGCQSRPAFQPTLKMGLRYWRIVGTDPFLTPFRARNCVETPNSDKSRSGHSTLQPSISTLNEDRRDARATILVAARWGRCVHSVVKWGLVQNSPLEYESSLTTRLRRRRFGLKTSFLVEVTTWVAGMQD